MAAAMAARGARLLRSRRTQYSMPRKQRERPISSPIVLFSSIVTVHIKILLGSDQG